MKLLSSWLLLLSFLLWTTAPHGVSCQEDDCVGEPSSEAAAACTKLSTNSLSCGGDKRCAWVTGGTCQVQDCIDFVNKRTVCLSAGCTTLFLDEESRKKYPNLDESEPDDTGEEDEIDWTTLLDSSDDNDDGDDEDGLSGLVIAAVTVVVLGIVVVVFVIGLWLHLFRERERVIELHHKNLEQQKKQEIQRVPTAVTMDDDHRKKPTSTEPELTTTESPPSRENTNVTIPKGADDNGGSGSERTMAESDIEELSC